MNTNSEITSKRANEANVIDKWGEAVTSGFTAVPNALIKSQHALGISSSELNVLMNLLLHWWFKSDLPFPSTVTIAKRAGMTPRTVQRHLKTLSEKKLIERITKNDRRQYSLEGLKAKLSYHSKNDTWTGLKEQI